MAGGGMNKSIRLQEFIKNFVDSYEMQGELDNIYTPSKKEKAIIEDAIHGLLVENGFIGLVAPKSGMEEALIFAEGFMYGLRNQGKESEAKYCQELAEGMVRIGSMFNR